MIEPTTMGRIMIGNGISMYKKGFEAVGMIVARKK